MIKRLAVASLLVLALLLVGVMIQRAFLSEQTVDSGSDKPVTASTSATAEAGRTGENAIVVKKISGAVSRKGKDGQWRPLVAGDRVEANDFVRTASDSTATLHLGSDVQLHIADTTEIRIAEVSRTLARIGLADGRLASEVETDKGRRLKVRIRGTDTTAETKGGKMAVMRRGNGPVAVAAEKGSATVTAKQRAVQLKAGQQSVVALGEPPSPPSDIPPSLYLKLAALPTRVVSGQRLVLRGQTLPGAVVSIGGVVAASEGASGSFSHTLVLQEGSNEFVVSVEDVIGRRSSQRPPPIQVTPKPTSTNKSGRSDAGLGRSDAGLEGKVVW